MTGLTFEPSTHSYTLAGARLESVTGVIRRAGHLDDLAWFGSPDALRRGRLVHALTLAVDLTAWDDLRTPQPLPPYGLPVPRELVVAGPGGRLSVACPEALRGYVEAYQAVRAVYGAPAWDRAEEPLARADLGLAGTPDRVGVFNGVPAVVEIKTGSWATWHGYQLAAYDMLEPLPFERRRIGVYLRADGDYRVRRYEDPEDAMEFLRALGPVRV